MHRLLPLFLLVLVFSFLTLNFQAVKREVYPKLGLKIDNTDSCCDPKVIAKSNGNFDENASRAIFDNQVVDYPKTSLAHFDTNIAQTTPNNKSAVLGISANANGEEKWIEVSLKDQILRAWEGTTKVMEFPISSGRWAPTPTGTFNIWYKTRNQAMVGGDPSIGTYYNLPNVPNNMFFSGGFALHGAYWHNNFGHPMSHGCVNEPLASAAQIFEWAGPVVPAGQNSVRAAADNPGTRVVVHN